MCVCVCVCVCVFMHVCVCLCMCVCVCVYMYLYCVCAFCTSVYAVLFFSVKICRQQVVLSTLTLFELSTYCSQLCTSLLRSSEKHASPESQETNPILPSRSGKSEHSRTLGTGRHERAQYTMSPERAELCEYWCVGW